MKSTKTVSERITPVAIQTAWNITWTDGERQDVWHGALKFRGRGGPLKRFRKPFATEADAMAHAEWHRQRCIKADRMPETMEERQYREDDEEEAAEAGWAGKKARRHERP